MRHSRTYRGLVVEQNEPRIYTRRIVERTSVSGQQGEVVIQVRHSAVNYKDALSATGHPGVTRQFPHIPGIDAAGYVLSAPSGKWQPGQEVLVTGFDLGMETDGGWGEQICVPESWVIPLPAGLTTRTAMALGTAGFTAALSIQTLENAGLTPLSGEVLVTGATGGVGSLAVAMLAKSGYQVMALSGKADKEAFLYGLGAKAVLTRDELLQNQERPLLKERFAAVVDVVGGDVLAAALKATSYGGAVTCCGLVGSFELNLNVYPFILRGVSLFGIDSVHYPADKRPALWQRMANSYLPEHLEAVITDITLEQLEPAIHGILNGQTSGRIVVHHQLFRRGDRLLHMS